MKYLIIFLTGIAATGCQKAAVSVESALRPEDLLSDSARVELHLPPKTELTLASKTDMEYVKKVSPETIKAVETFLKPTGRDIQISAARPVGDYLLLWIAFPKVADGGVDLIFSAREKKVVGTFCGGYRG